MTTTQMPMAEPVHPEVDDKKPHWVRRLVAGAITGEVAGLIMGAAMMAAFTIFLGKGPLYPLQVIGSLFLGDSALEGMNLLAAMLGLSIHLLGPSLFWGVMLGWLVGWCGCRCGMGLWVMVALVTVASQLVDVYVLLPWAFVSLQGHNLWAEQVPPFWSWAARVVYGAGLTAYPWVEAQLARRMGW